MHFFHGIVLSFAALIVPALAQTSVSISYDTTYDDSTASLDIVACSDGANGLITKGFTTIGSLPSFPRVGGAAAIAGWNSASCGTCWQLSFDGVSINVLAIDHAGDGFNVAQEVMDELTNGQAVFLGRVTGTAVQVNASLCGL